MPIPLFIIYELIIRIQRFDPSIGSYVSHTFNNQGAVVTTTTCTIRVKKAILNRQFKDPELVKDADLMLLIKKKHTP